MQIAVQLGLSQLCWMYIKKRSVTHNSLVRISRPFTRTIRPRSATTVPMPCQYRPNYSPARRYAPSTFMVWSLGSELTLLPGTVSTASWHAVQLTYSMEHSPWDANRSLQLVKKFPAFYGTRRFFTVQVPATCPYPEPTPSIPHNILQRPEDPS
jgi:hypothetical protein